MQFVAVIIQSNNGLAARLNVTFISILLLIHCYAHVIQQQNSVCVLSVWQSHFGSASYGPPRTSGSSCCITHPDHGDRNAEGLINDAAKAEEGLETAGMRTEPRPSPCNSREVGGVERGASFIWGDDDVKFALEQPWRSRRGAEI